MKEVTDIVNAYEHARKNGLRVALATVVQVEGSSYRRPGARMLVAEDGKLTGAISGGCLEGDALRKALLAINEQRNKIVTYDTTDEDDAKFGVQLGCNGIVHILFEPIIENETNNPVILLQKAISERKNAIVITLFSLDHKCPQLGTCVLYRDNEQHTNKNLEQDMRALLTQEATNVLCYKQSHIKQFSTGACRYTAFFSFIRPVIQLVIAGAGNDVIPLANIAALMGWHTVIADGRADHPTSQRFPSAQTLLVVKPRQLLEQVTVDEQTVFVLMTHNYNYDLELLKLLIQTDADYIGVLGPKKKLERMLNELQEQGITISNEQRNKIYGPVGLDIGAETAEEIALSVAAEIKAVLSARNGQSLRLETGPIHERSNIVDLYNKRLRVS